MVVIFVAQMTGSDALVLLAFFFHFVFVIGINVIVHLFIVPIMIRAGLRSSFSEAFDFAWVKDFVSKMWLEQVLGLIIWSIISWFIMLVGILAFCIGIIPAIGVVAIAYWSFLTQLYQVYIGRGGQPVRFSPIPRLAFASNPPAVLCQDGRIGGLFCFDGLCPF